jgi:hypothetical protein
MMGETFFAEAQSYLGGEMVKYRHIMDRERLLSVLLTQPVSDVNGRIRILATETKGEAIGCHTDTSQFLALVAVCWILRRT